MDNPYIFTFKTDLSNIPIPLTLNNPYGTFLPKIAKIAAQEFQDFISEESKQWEHDFLLENGKMFGVLVVQTIDNALRFLGTISGKMFKNDKCSKFIPSVFDEATDDFFIDKGMAALSKMSRQINHTQDASEVILLKKIRKNKSIALQQQLFEHYHFLNLSGQKKNLLDIFAQASSGYPPAAAGECAAPKLFQYAIQNQLKPIALAEFWWGATIKDKTRTHKVFYPACKNRCRPILEYILEDTTLYEKGIST